jgi:signal transduction histidine kinase
MLGRLAVIGFCLILLTTGCSPLMERASSTPIVNGRLDLSGRDWEENGPLPLDGQWRFNWTNDADHQRSDNFSTINVPGTWGGSLTVQGMKMDGQGYGIYMLSVQNPKSQPLMAIRVPNIATAYSMYIDHVLVQRRGEIGFSADTSKPFQLPATVYYEPKDKVTDIRLIVSNFDHRNGGIRTPLVMGTAEQIESFVYRRQAQEWIIFGSFLMIALYHFGLYALRRKDTANIYFALLCLFIAARMGVIGEGLLIRVLPFFTWESALKTEYICFVLSGWTGFAYFQKMFPGEIAKKWRLAFSVYGALLISITLSLAPIQFTKAIIAYQIYVLLIGAWLLTALVLSAVRKREGARLALVGVAGLVVAVVNDITFYNGWRQSPDLVPYGQLFLIFMNSFIIAQRFSRTFDRAEQLSAELKQWNSHLEEKIDERTEQLRGSLETLEEAKLGLERAEQSRRQLVSNISHDLRTPMTLIQGYLEALRDDVITEPEQRGDTIRLMLSKAEGLNRLIDDLFELSVLEAGRVDHAPERWTVEDWKERIQKQFALEMREAGHEFHCSVRGDRQDAKAIVEIDVYRMDRVFANLLYNALRYLPSDGAVSIDFNVREDRRSVEVLVADNGSGIAPDDLAHVFDRFYKNNKSRHSSSGGSGLGLSISREIVGLNGGTITAENRPEGGCLFRMIFPAAEIYA